MFGDTTILDGAGGDTLLGAPVPDAVPQDLGATLFGDAAHLTPFYNLRTVDNWGAIQIPVDGGPQGGLYPTADPALKYILDYLTAFLVTDLGLTVPWSQVNDARSPVPVLKTFPYDPDDVIFREADLPALFLWRESGRSEYIADDELRETTILKLRWIPPPVARELKKIRHSFFNGLAKAITVAIERGRTPSFVVTNDPDPAAITAGSLFYTFAAFDYLAITEWRRDVFREEMGDGSPARFYDAWTATLEMHEHLVYGLDRFAPLSVPYGGYLTIANETGLVVDAGPI